MSYYILLLMGAISAALSSPVITRYGDVALVNREHGGVGCYIQHNVGHPTKPFCCAGAAREGLDGVMSVLNCQPITSEFTCKPETYGTPLKYCCSDWNRKTKVASPCEDFPPQIPSKPIVSESIPSNDQTSMNNFSPIKRRDGGTALISGREEADFCQSKSYNGAAAYPQCCNGEVKPYDPRDPKSIFVKVASCNSVLRDKECTGNTYKIFCCIRFDQTTNLATCFSEAKSVASYDPNLGVPVALGATSGDDQTVASDTNPGDGSAMDLPTGDY